MKKYRLKEEVKKYFTNLEEEVDSEQWWLDTGFTLEALEEVKPPRIELIRIDHPIDVPIGDGKTRREFKIGLSKFSNSDISKEEMDLCEKALNGELYSEFHLLACVEYCRDSNLSSTPAWREFLELRRNK